MFGFGFLIYFFFPFLLFVIEEWCVVKYIPVRFYLKEVPTPRARFTVVQVSVINLITFQELDEKEYLSLWLVMCEIRNRYCSLHDIVIKNLEKIKKPRSSNAESLY